MKKLVYLLVLALLVVPAFAAITVTTSASGSLSFKSQLSPWPVTFKPSASLSLIIDLSGDNKTVGNIVAEINAVSDLSLVSVTTEDITYVTDVTYTDGTVVVHTATKTVVTGVDYYKSFTTTGRLTFKGIAGLVDLSLNKGTLSVGDTKLVDAILDGDDDGIGVVVNAPVKVTVGYKPETSDALTYTKGVLAVRADGSFAPVTFYGLFVKDTTYTASFAVGASAKPISMLDVFGEFARDKGDSKYIVGGTVTPISLVSLYGEYSGAPNTKTYKLSATVTPISLVSLYGEYSGTSTNDSNTKTYKLSATVTPISNVTLYGEYSGTYTTTLATTIYAYAKATQSLPVGTLSAWVGLKKIEQGNVYGGYLKLDTPLGPATNTLRIYFNADVDDLDGDGSIDEFVIGDPEILKGSKITIDNKISVSF